MSNIKNDYEKLMELTKEMKTLKKELKKIKYCEGVSETLGIEILKMDRIALKLLMESY